MAFHSYNFILYFLPVFTVGFFLIGWLCRGLRSDRRLLAQQLWCLAASAFYYYLNESDLWWVIVLLLAINYGLIRLMQRPDVREEHSRNRTCLLIAGIALNVLVLFVFKYLQTALALLDLFLGTSMGETLIPSPAGLSFLTFQQIIYLTAAWKQETKGDSLIDYLTYMTWFPKALSGPITPREELVSSFHMQEKTAAPRAASVDSGRRPAGPAAAEDRTDTDCVSGHVLSGIVLFCYGLGKKVLLADVLALAVDWGFENTDVLTAADALIVMLAYTFQIYYDFSGYTDMARGISRMVGIELPLNFDSPYHALSIRDFWKRWHLSLTGFLTRYIYIPLGGSRQGTVRTCVNTMIVFLISGMWHGSAPSFVLWGLLHGLFSVFDRLCSGWEEKLPRILRWAVTFLCINLLWLLFRTRSISTFLRMVRIMFSGFGAGVSSGLTEALAEMSLLPGVESGAVLAIYLLIAFLLCLLPRNTNRFSANAEEIGPKQMAWAIVLLVVSLFCLGSVGSFLYFNF